MTARHDNYDAEWADLRWRIRLFWIVFLGYLPGVGLIATLARTVSPKWADNVALAAAIGWMIAFAAAGFYRFMFRCPRCGDYFFHALFWQNSLARKCVNCGLPRWSNPPDPERS